MIIPVASIAHVTAPSDTVDATNTNTNRVKGTQDGEATHTTTEGGAATTASEGALVNEENVRDVTGTTQSVEDSHMHNKYMGGSRR